MEYIVYLIPLIILVVSLAIVSAIHVIRHPHYKCGNKVLWLIVVLFVQIIGPILYFTIGKGDDE
ncbi:MAG: PLD nuclease N-terminal domain-containing protein [Coprobacillus sp.]